MNNSLMILFIFGVSLVSMPHAFAADTADMADLNKPLALPDCYNLALKQSENIAINTELIKITEAHFMQALSVMLPHLYFKSTDMQEESPNEPSATFSSQKPAKSSDREFNVTQNLFTGFKAIAALKGSKFEKWQRVKEKERAEQLLLVDVANTFYILLQQKEDLKALERIKLALLNRIKELKAREKLGRSRTSEVVNAKAQLYSVDASIEVVKSQEVVARQLLEFLVGRPVRELADTYEIPNDLFSEEYYLSRYSLRPDVEAAKDAWLVSRMGVDIANSGFLPTVDVNANYYTQRTAFEKDTDWDVTLNIKVPIFEGTQVIGNVREAESKARSDELTYLRTKRKAPYEIKDAYVRLKTAMDVQIILKKAFNTARTNYYLQRKDYERSLVNNLEVLAAIQTLQDAQRNYISAMYSTKRLYWQLRVTVGETITESLYDAF